MRALRIVCVVVARGLAHVAQRLAGWQFDAARREAARRSAEPLDILFGTRAVARFMGLSKNQARAPVARGAVPAFQLDGVTCARRSSIVRHLAALEAAGRPEASIGGHGTLKGGRDGDRHEA